MTHPTSPALAQFLAGAPIEYDAGKYGRVTASYRNVRLWPTRVLVIRQASGKKRLIRQFPMPQNEAESFFLNLMRVEP